MCYFYKTVLMNECKLEFSMCFVSFQCVPEFLQDFALWRIVLLASTKIKVILHLDVVLILVPVSYNANGGSNQIKIKKVEITFIWL